MPEANSSTTDDVETNSGVPDLSRRTILHGAAATGALLLGAGTAAGNGQGGQAVVKENDFEAEKQFTIDKGPFEKENDRIDFQCNGQGEKIRFPTGSSPTWTTETRRPRRGRTETRRPRRKNSTRGTTRSKLV